MSIAKSLSEEQVATIQSWADEGDELSEIQNKLRSEMDVHVTYMEMRFLMDDLSIQLKSDPVPEKQEPEEEQLVPDDDPPAAGDELLPEESTEASGEVSVTVDKVQRPGAAISGTVSFGGGNSAEWTLDQMGQLGMNPKNEGFRPTEEQVMAFQQELQRVVQEGGR